MAIFLNLKNVNEFLGTSEVIDFLAGNERTQWSKRSGKSLAVRSIKQIIFIVLYAMDGCKCGPNIMTMTRFDLVYTVIGSLLKACIYDVFKKKQMKSVYQNLRLKLVTSI